MRGLGAAFAVLLGAVSATHADTLLIEAVDKTPPNTAAGLPRPHTGQNMADVKAQFGEPASTQPAVGEPPITRWAYPGFTVYFERDRVIESVVHR